MKLADKIIEHEEAMIKDDMTASELEKGMKDIVAVAAATSVPVTALFFSGSVVGLSAAGITSGLAALGLGGVLGLSAMVTGIGAVVVLGVRLGAERASQMYYRLLLIASNDEVRSGRYVGESLGIRRINVGEKLSKELLKVPARRRPLKVASLLEDLLDDAEGDGVLLNRIEILFEESLKVEPLTLLGRHALGRTLADVLRCPPTPRVDLSSVRARP